MKIPNPKSIRSQSSAISNKTLEIQCLIGNPKFLPHPSRLLQFSCFKKRFKPGGFSLTLSLSLLYSGFRTTRSNSNQKTRKSNKDLVRTQFEPWTLKNRGWQMHLFWNCEDLKLPTTLSPQLQCRNSQPFLNSTECNQFNSIEWARSEFLGSSNPGIWAATATIFPGAKLTLTKVVSRGGAKEIKSRHVAVSRCTGSVKMTWRPVAAT